MHPCSSCHQWVKSDPRPRNLKRPHDNFTLEHGLHGKGKFWCFTCHDLDGQGGLRTLEGEKLDFADAYVLVQSVSSNQARDWVYGAHGKRVGGWQGKRQVSQLHGLSLSAPSGLQARVPRNRGRSCASASNGRRIGLPRMVEGHRVHGYAGRMGTGRGRKKPKVRHWWRPRADRARSRRRAGGGSLATRRAGVFSRGLPSRAARARRMQHWGPGAARRFPMPLPTSSRNTISA